MLFKILKEYLRRITRNYKIYAISILGMGIAIIASFHIYHFVYKELSVDAFHTKRKEIYRLVNNNPNANTRYTTTFFPVGPLLKDKLPEVENYTRIANFEKPFSLEHKGESNRVILTFVDTSFFELFDFPLVAGSLKQFQDTPNGVVLSEKKSKQLFQDKNPIGKIISIKELGGTGEWKLQVTGIVKDFPDESTIQGDYFVNMASVDMVDNYYKSNPWNVLMVDLYLYAPNVNDLNSYTDKIKDVIVAEANLTRNPRYPMQKDQLDFDFQPLNTIYFDSQDIQKQKRKGDYQFVKIIILVGLLTLFLAVSNYILMNLGLNMNRAKEFKMKRCLGASKGIVFFQILIESLFNALICFALVFITYPLFKGVMNDTLGFHYELSLHDDIYLIALFSLIIAVIACIIGILEFILSYTQIFTDDKDQGFSHKSSWLTKKIMIWAQLFLFVSLFICLLFINKQVEFIRSKDIGFKFENIISLYPANIRNEIKNELKSKSYVNSIADGEQLYRTDLSVSTMTILETKQEIESMLVLGDADYLKVHQIDLLYGSNLNPDLLPNYDNWTSPDRKRGIAEVLVNEEFVRRANLKNPIGTRLRVHGESVIVGVFKNINNLPLYYSLQPIVIGYDFSYITSEMQISYVEGYEDKVLSDIQNVFKSKGMEQEFHKDYNVKTLHYADVYKKEFQLKRLLQAFAIIFLVISLLGLVAISLFITESKTKEIGIRRVNGASVREILYMLNKDFIKWVLIAFIIAVPISFYIMKKWLENFAYKTELSWWVFALAGLFNLIIALLTVSWQTYKAATRNPVESLRDE